jgi:hypothetical protein
LTADTRKMIGKAVVLSGLSVDQARPDGPRRPPCVGLLVSIDGDVATVRLFQGAGLGWCVRKRQCHARCVKRLATPREAQVGQPVAAPTNVRTLTRLEIARLYPGVAVSA